MTWHICLTVLLCACILMVPDYAFAYTEDVTVTRGRNVTPMGLVFCTVVTWVNGNTSKGIATLGVIYLGVKAKRGKIGWKKALFVGSGIAAIFGAIPLVNVLSDANGMNNRCVYYAPTGSSLGFWVH